jgi:hypothetical protein
MAARSSSGIRRYSCQGMMGKSARPSNPMPSRMARARASSLASPIPVSGSGVMLAATSQGRSWKAQSVPAPWLSTTGAPTASQSRSLWQARHPWTELTG